MSSASFVALRGVSFAHVAATENLFSNLSVNLGQGFTGVVGANGTGKSTLLKLVVGELQATGGHIEGAHDGVYCEQRTDLPPADLHDFLEDWQGDAITLRRNLAIGCDFATQWAQLSHGERKRAQIAHALWKKPELLAIDEPTNHIDAAAKHLLIDALSGYQGVGIIVSHDRALLDQLCHQCVWLSPPTAQVHVGGYSRALTERESRRHTALKERSKAQRSERKLSREVMRQREFTAREHRMRSKRGLDKRDHDAKEKIDRARLSDGSAGKQLKQMESRSRRARAEVQSAVVEKEYQTGIWLSGVSSKRDVLLRLPSQQIAIGDEGVLNMPPLVMLPSARVAITGDNGAGKTTLIQHLRADIHLSPEEVLYLPQEVTWDQSNELLETVRVLPKSQLGDLMNIVSRLGSRPERLLQSKAPSPGEIRKLLLALGIVRKPQLLVLDEPTNHLDLPSIDALEKALLACPAGIIFVSHDEHFVKRLANARWEIQMRNTVRELVIIE